MKSYIISPDHRLWDTLCNLNTMPAESIDPDINFLICGILIESEGMFLARALCYLNPHHLIEGKNYVSIGYLYCEDDFSIFQFLSRAILEAASNANVSQVLGPMNGSTWNEYRVVSSNQESPFLLEPVTAPYLVNFFEQEWSQLASYHSQHSVSMEDNWSKVSSRYDYFVDEGVQFIEFDKSNAKELFEELALFCNSTFSKNFLFSPISTEEFVSKMMRILPILDPQFTLIARDLEGKMVGFIFAYEDLLNTTEKTIVIKTLARLLERSYAGLGSVLLSLVMRKAKEEGFVASIHALMMETNASNRISAKFNGEQYRSYSLYSKSV